MVGVDQAEHQKRRIALEERTADHRLVDWRAVAIRPQTEQVHTLHHRVAVLVKQTDGGDAELTIVQLGVGGVLVALRNADQCEVQVSLAR